MAKHNNYTLKCLPMELNTGLYASSHSTAMCWAASEGNLKAMRQLREDHGTDVNAVDSNKRTPLHIAVSNENLEITSYLLQCGANTEVLDRWGRSPIDCAVETKNVAILRLLGREQQGQIPVFHTKFGSIDDRSEIRRMPSSSDVELFFQAIQEGHTDQVKRWWLSGMEVNVADDHGRTSLHVAVESRQLGVIELLLSAGVNANVADASGRSPITIAREQQQFGIVEILRAHQKNKLMSHRLKSSKEGQNVALAFRATKQGEMEILKRLVPEIVPPDVEDYDLRTLLHVASAEGHLQIAQYLVKCGANVNLLDRWGSSPLSEAVDFAHNELARFLTTNCATACGFRATVAVDHINTATLDEALEFTLRVITRDPWLIGQVRCPVMDDDNKCLLLMHSIWQKSRSLTQQQHQTKLPLLSSKELKDRPVDTAALWAGCIQKYRKVSSMVMIDPGQGHVGNVFCSQHPEWLILQEVQQSRFFLLPHARQAGFQTVVSVPMVCKMSTVAVLSWYSDRTISEDLHELQRIQRVVRSVMILSTLRQESHSDDSVTVRVGRIPQFQFCQMLDNAITANGELTDSSTLREDRVCDTMPLALEWGLFDMVDTLATSMSSEDHAAVISILRSLVVLLCNGLFSDVLCVPGNGGSHEQNDEVTLKHLVEECDGKIRTKQALLGHVKYYLQYLYAVSPTEAELFGDVCELLDKVKEFSTKTSSVDELFYGTLNPIEEDTSETDVGPNRSPSSESAQIDVPDCVLCKFGVSGHIHPGQGQDTALLDLVMESSNQKKPMEFLRGNPFFGDPKNPRSPVYRQIEQLHLKLEGEYDAFKRRSELAECCDGTKPAVFTSSDLYDAIGFAHEPLATFRNTSADNSRQKMLDVITEILHDTTCVISREQLFALHRYLLPASTGQAGVLRTEAAVGYASPRIYRVFVPAGEIETALDNFLDALNDASRWERRPLLCAYYAFAVLVFYIHPFHDGNGRCARLLGNLVCKKLGFPTLLRAADKTIQMAEFMQKAIATMEILRNTRRQTRQTRLLSTRRESTSMWF